MVLVRANSSNQDFKSLVKKLDIYLAVTDGDEHEFYNQFNGLENLKNVVIIYSNNIAVACGAFKEFDEHTVEIKRMFTLDECRGKGFATRTLKELEFWASELNYTQAVLETGIRQLEAINFYRKNDYKLIENYRQYKGIANSKCFIKIF